MPDGAGPAGPLHAGEHLLAGADPVHLEERLRVGRDDLLDRLAGERGQPHRHAAGGGGPGDGDLAVGVHRLHAGRADQHRHRHRLAHDRDAHVPLVGQARRCAARSRARRRRAVLSSAVSPRSEPATSAPYTPLGSRFFARRCASATVSNHAFAIVGTPRRPGPAGSSAGLDEPVALSAMLAGAVRPPPHPAATSCAGIARDEELRHVSGRLAGKVAFITGAARGQGRAHAVRLAPRRGRHPRPRHRRRRCRRACPTTPRPPTTSRRPREAGRGDRPARADPPGRRPRPRRHEGVRRPPASRSSAGSTSSWPTPASASPRRGTRRRPQVFTGHDRHQRDRRLEHRHGERAAHRRRRRTAARSC